MKRLTAEYTLKLFGNYLKDEGYKTHDISGRLLYCRKLFTWLKEKEDVLCIRDVTTDHIKRFFLFTEETGSKMTGRKYSPRTIIGMAVALRKLFKCLYLEDLIIRNPMRNIRINPKGAGKPKEIMSIEEISILLDSISTDIFLGRRDRAIFELIYSSGLRAGEVSNLDIKDIDFENRMVRVLSGKFGKDRIVPISLVALKFLKKYAGMKKKGILFWGKYGRLSTEAINRRFKKHLHDAGMYRKGLSTHSIRHCTATHLLSSGADLRYVQDLLGHDSIETTVTYTHDIFDNIKKIYRSHHPRENNYFKEVDNEYLTRLNDFRERVVYQKKRSLQRRQSTKKRYLRIKGLKGKNNRGKL